MMERLLFLPIQRLLNIKLLRTTLLPGILKTLRENKAMGLPVGVFEVSDVALQDETLERKARNERTMGWSLD